jgi:hypothetical protein
MERSDMRSPLLAWLILLAACESACAAEWKVDTCLFYRLHFTVENEAAMQRVKALLTGFHQRFQQSAGTNLDFGKSTVDVHFHPPGSKEVSLGYVVLHGGVTTGNHPPFYRGTLKMPGPASYDGQRTSSCGHPMDKNYFEKLLIHEVSAVHLDFLCQSNHASFFSMPSWFVQGLEEYFAVLHSTDYWRREGIKYYYRRLRRAPHGIDTAFGLNVQDAYLDGFLLLHFIAQRYGEKAIFQILLDKDPSPGRRLRSHLPAFDVFIRDLETWKPNKLQRGIGGTAVPPC